MVRFWPGQGKPLRKLFLGFLGLSLWSYTLDNFWTRNTGLGVGKYQNDDIHKMKIPFHCKLGGFDVSLVGGRRGNIDGGSRC